MTTTNILYAITGATGNIGSRLASLLLSKGKKVRVIGRSKDKLKQFSSHGAETVAANLENMDDALKALQGASAVFAMIPPKYSAPDFRQYQNTVGESIVKGIEAAEIKHVVNLSSVGAHLDQGTGPILGLHDQEKRLNKVSGVNIVHLRPTYFMENLFVNIPLIQQNGIMGSPLKARTSLPMIATKDIAAAAAHLLTDLDFSGVTTHELLGPAEYTMEEIAKVFAKALNKKDLNYVEFPYADAEKAMVQMGLSADTARLVVEMNKSFNEGWVKPQEKRSARNTTPTTIQEFSQIFADIFNAANKVPTAI